MINFCSKCGNKIEGKASFCPNCGEKIEDKKTVDSTKKSVISIVLFIISIIFYYLFVISVAGDEGLLGFYITFLLLPFLYFFIFSIVLSVSAIKSFKKNSKPSRKILNYINKFQFVLIIIIFISSIPIFYKFRDAKLESMRKELEQKYGNNYDIVDECRGKSTYLGDSPEDAIVFKLKNENMYSFIISDGNNRDGTQGLKKGKNVSLDNYFNENYFSLADIYYNYYNNSVIKLGIIIDSDDYSIDELESKLKELKKDFNDIYHYVSITVYLIDTIDYSNLDYYNYFLTSKLADADCLEIEDKNLIEFSKNDYY